VLPDRSRSKSKLSNHREWHLEKSTWWTRAHADVTPDDQSGWSRRRLGSRVSAVAPNCVAPAASWSQLEVRKRSSGSFQKSPPCS